MKKSQPVLTWLALGALAFTTSVTLAAPRNDFYLRAEPISGPSGAVVAEPSSVVDRPTTVTGASAENGEPLHAGVGGNSVWFRWTAPIDGVATFTTAGSAIDTVLGAYQGRSLVSAVLLGENDDDIAANVSTSAVSFPIAAGTTYHIAVAGPDTGGDFVLAWNTYAGGVVRFAREAYTASEAAGSATITLERIGQGLAPLAVPIVFGTGLETTATADEDFAAAPLTANFAAGENTATVTLPILPDTEVEGDETLVLTLGVLGGNAVLDAQSTALLTIRDAQDDPANDAFAGATVLNGASGVVAADNVAASLEAGEPLHGGVADGRSVWFRFTAPAAGALLLDTAGSAVDGTQVLLDTILDVYTGSSVGALTPVASSDDQGEAVTSRVVLPVAAGVTYAIAVDSREDVGQIQLAWQFSAGGFVQFAAANFPTTDAAVAVTVTVARAGSASGEASVTFNTADAGSAVAGTNYTATSGTLNFAPGEASKSFTVPLLNNTAIDGDKTFNVQLSNVTGSAVPGQPTTATVTIQDLPENDHFAAALTLSGVADTVSGRNANARAEAGEPQHGAAGGRSIWYQWRAPANGAVSFDTEGSSDEDGEPLDTLLAVYTGSSVNALTRVAANDNTARSVSGRAAFRVTGGTTYFIAVDGRDGATGDIELAWAFSTRGLVQFSQPAYQVNENGGVATILVTRTDAVSLDPVSVSIGVEGDTATDGVDFGTASVDTLTLGAGEVSRSFTIPISPDAINEADETVNLTLVAGDTGAVLGERATATLTINDLADDPANDFIANATPITTNTGSTFVVTTGASRESGEPRHGDVNGHRSVWFRWTTPVAGRASLETAGSLAPGGVPLDTVLAVYTGSSLSALTPVAVNDDAQPGTKTSRVSFNAAAGTSYFIAVDSSGEDGGEVSLSWALGGGGLLQFRQPQYAVRENVPGGLLTITVDRVGSTSGAVSVAWRTVDGTATSGGNGDFTAQTAGTLNLPAGATTASFTVAITNDGAIEGNESFTVELSTPQGGAILSSTVVTASVLIDDDDDDPANDLFANASTLTGASGSVSSAVAAANLEAGEPPSAGGHTIWFRWTAPANGNVQFSTSASSPVDTLLAAYTGTTLATLQPVAANDDAGPGTLASRLGFAALGGRTYFIAVDARDPVVDPVTLSFELTTGGAFGFGAPSYRVNENAGPVQIVVNRTGTSANAATVEYEIVPGAIPGFNYTQAGTLSFGAGQVTRTFSLPIPQVTGEQLFTVRLKNASFGAVIAQETVDVRIVDLTTRPANDSFGSATPFVVTPTDTDGTLTGTTVGASRDAGEFLPSPLLRNVGGGRTIWFQWRAPGNGTVTFNTAGSTEAGTGDPLDTVLAVFTGRSAAQLTLVAENDESPEEPKTSAVSFLAISGRNYFIAVDTVGDATGAVNLSWTLEPPEEGPLLAPAPGFTPTITFREVYSEALRPDGFGDFETVPTNDIDATFTLSLAQVDVTGLTAATPVSVSIGDFAHEAVLGDDRSFREGRRSATFNLTVENDRGGEVRVGSVRYSWTDTTLTIRITASRTDAYPIYAATYGDGIETTEASASFAGVAGTRAIYVTGTSVTRTVTRSTGDYDLVRTEVTGTADFVKPTVTLTAPTATEVNPNTETIDLAGTAADNYALTGVTVSVNGAEPLEATLVAAANGLSGTWTLAGVPLVPGVTTLTITATDESGNTGTQVRTITRPRQAPISITTQGQGTVTSSFTGTLLNLGVRYTLTATPAAGWLFQGWSANDGTSSPAASLSFVMSEGLQITATFIPNPFENLRGSFSGFVRSSNFVANETGPIALDVTSTGSFTGSVTLGSRRTSISGSFDLNGNYSAVVLVRNRPAYTITLRLDLVNGSEQVTGTITDGTFVSGITADRAIYSATAATPLSGFKYTVALAGSAGYRGATNGFVTAVVAGDGSVRFAGSLGDGVAISTSGFLPRSGVVQIYATRSNTTMAGALVFSPTPAAEVTGGISWVRPNGSVTELTARGERWDTAVAPLGPVAGGATTATVGGLTLLPTTTQNITIVNGSALVNTAAAPGLRTISVTFSAGTFTASGRQSNGRPFTARGVLLQKSGVGVAFITLGDSIGYMVIGAP